MEPNDDLCDACGYHLVLKKVIDISDMKKPNKTTGFERLFQEQLHESDSSRNTLLLMKVVGAVVLVGLMFLCLGAWWWVGVLVVAAGGAFYWASYRKRAAAAASDESTVNQDPLSAALWSLLLSLQRIAGWRKLTWPFPCAAALALRDATFGDDELEELNGLGDIEALDLEGTGITNEGLRHLKGLKRLRFLVVRRTKITPAAARRLQLDLPQAMIWY